MVLDFEYAGRKGRKELCDFIEQLREGHKFVGFYQKVSGRYSSHLKSSQELGLECDKEGIRKVEKYKAEWNKLQNELVVSNLRFVVQIVNLYASSKGKQDYMDLIQEGYLGLLRAVGGYDYRKGIKFSTYASGWIKQIISKSIKDNSRTKRIPINMWRASQAIKEAENKIQQRKERDNISLEELAQETGFPVKKVELVKKAFGGEASLDTPFTDDDGEPRFLLDLVADLESLKQEEEVSSSEKTERLKMIMAGASLTPKEENVLRMRFGFDRKETITLEEIGKTYDVTRERIRQIESRALGKLRQASIRIF